MKPTKDLVGQTFGKLTVVAQAEHYVQPGNGRAKPMWLCRCVCGNEKAVRGEHLRNGEISSCGCARGNAETRPANVRYSRSKTGARQRGLSFGLTLEEFDAITSRLCHYCGGMPGTHNGIDRVDSSIGYEPANCVPCCWICNRFKGEDLSPAQLAEHARRVYLKSIE